MFGSKRGSNEGWKYINNLEERYVSSLIRFRISARARVDSRVGIPLPSRNRYMSLRYETIRLLEAKRCF